MLRGEHTRSKQPEAFCLDHLKTKTRYADLFKGGKQEISNKASIWKLKIKKPITNHK